MYSNLYFYLLYNIVNYFAAGLKRCEGGTCFCVFKSTGEEVPGTKRPREGFTLDCNYYGGKLVLNITYLLLFVKTVPSSCFNHTVACNSLPPCRENFAYLQPQTTYFTFKIKMHLLST